MKKGLFIIAMLLALPLSGCDALEGNQTIAYGSKFDLQEYLKLEEGEVSDVSLSVDTSIIGKYVVKGSVKKEDKVVREVDERVFVKDTQSPEIKTVQSFDEIYEIPFEDAFNILGNIEYISDQVDGEYKEIQIVDQKTYDDFSKKCKDLKREALKHVFTINEEVQAVKDSREKNGYSMITSNVDTKKAGIYEISVLCVDKSYNVEDITYKLKVLKKDEKANDKMLAAGATGSTTGAGINYQVSDMTKTEEVSNPEVEVPVDPGTGNAEVSVVEEFKANIVPNNSVSAQGSPVLQAALNLVGSPMMCDDLVTMALVNGGMITGTPASIFQSGSSYNLGVYQFPSIGQFISASQAVPGDLVFYDNGGYGSSHIAVYAGNGQAVHGGWNGMNVVISGVNIGSGPRYMRFGATTWQAIEQTLFGYKQEAPSPTPPAGSNSGSPEASIPNLPEGAYPGGGSTTYRFMKTIGETSIAVSSTTPVDSDFVSSQFESHVNGEITYEQMIANLQAGGYTIIDPF